MQLQIKKKGGFLSKELPRPLLKVSCIKVLPELRGVLSLSSSTESHQVYAFWGLKPLSRLMHSVMSTEIPPLVFTLQVSQ